MGDSFETQKECVTAFQDALDPFIPKTAWLPPEQWDDRDGAGVGFDGVLNGLKVQFQAKTEGESSDGYLQNARAFQVFLSWMKTNRSRRMQDGAPVFILVIQVALQ